MMIEPAIRYFEVHPIVASADCETRMQILARISREDAGLRSKYRDVGIASLGRRTQLVNDKD